MLFVVGCFVVVVTVVCFMNIFCVIDNNINVVIIIVIIVIISIIIIIVVDVFVAKRFYGEGAFGGWNPGWNE